MYTQTVTTLSFNIAKTLEDKHMFCFVHISIIAVVAIIIMIFISSFPSFCEFRIGCLVKTINAGGVKKGTELKFKKLLHL